MKHHPRQNITLKIYSVSDDTANLLMTALGKLLHSPRFIRKAERWKLFRSTPPAGEFTRKFMAHIRAATGKDYPRAGHQMTIAERRDFQKLGALCGDSYPSLYIGARAGRFDSSKPNEANKTQGLFIGVDFARSDEVSKTIRKVVRNDIERQPRVRTNAIAGQNTRGLR